MPESLEGVKTMGLAYLAPLGIPAASSEGQDRDKRQDGYYGVVVSR